MSRRIFANHAHIFPLNWEPNADTAALVRHLDACDIERGIAFAPLPGLVDGLENNNRWLREDMRGMEDRIVGFGTVDTARGDIEGQVDEIAELGFRGIKIHPAMQRLNIMSPEAQRIYARAEALGLFLVFHTGVHHYRIVDYSMLLFDEVAYHFPKLRFSMEHCGGYAFFSEAVAVLQNNKNRENPRVLPV